MLQYEKELDVVLQEIMIGWEVPGLAVGIVKGNDIVYAKGFGVQNLETRAPVMPDSVFCVQSVSTCFVATPLSSTGFGLTTGFKVGLVWSTLIS
jgi:CubicO group peptidase (beta-lactamase class C family)